LKVEELLTKLNSYLKSGNLGNDDDKQTILSLPQIVPSTNFDTNSIVETNYNPPIPETDEDDDDGALTAPLQKHRVSQQTQRKKSKNKSPP
jgi:hypothetical protein